MHVFLPELRASVGKARLLNQHLYHGYELLNGRDIWQLSDNSVFFGHEFFIMVMKKNS